MWKRLLNLFRRRRLQADVAGLSDRGLVRADNQDHILVNRGRMAFCVADGMGGGDGGAKASQIVCRAVGRAVANREEFPETVKRIHVALMQANAQIRVYAEQAGFTRQMASTAAILVIDREHADQAVVGYIGDSRVYRFRNGELQQITRDHTVARELSQRATNPAMALGLKNRQLSISHMLTRAIGIQPHVALDWRKLDVRRGDAFLICSDGVYDMVPEEELRAVLAAGGKAKKTVARLARKIVAGGAGDNYSLIVVKIGERK